MISAMLMGAVIGSFIGGKTELQLRGEATLLPV